MNRNRFFLQPPGLTSPRPSAHFLLRGSFDYSGCLLSPCFPRHLNPDFRRSQKGLSTSLNPPRAWGLVKSMTRGHPSCFIGVQWEAVCACVCVFSYPALYLGDPQTPKDPKWLNAIDVSHWLETLRITSLCLRSWCPKCIHAMSSGAKYLSETYSETRAPHHLGDVLRRCCDFLFVFRATASAEAGSWVDRRIERELSQKMAVQKCGFLEHLHSSHWHMPVVLGLYKVQRLTIWFANGFEKRGASRNHNLTDSVSFGVSLAVRYCLSFLANVSVEDAAEWLESCGVTLLQDPLLEVDGQTDKHM